MEQTPKGSSEGKIVAFKIHPNKFVKGITEQWEIGLVCPDHFQSYVIP